MRRAFAALLLGAALAAPAFAHDGTHEDSQTEAPETTAEAEVEGVEFLPDREIFDPLLADPRQPYFSVAALWYLDDPQLGVVGSANLGETFAIWGGALGDESLWEIGLLGGVFTIFDLEAPSSDLVNTDFLVGPTFSLRRGPVSGQVRVYHQSSHLGDEFLLRNRVRRVNLSYEGVDVLGSVELHPAVRVYAGGGAIFHDEPNLDPWSAQVGIELRSPWTLCDGVVRPIAAGDLQLRQQHEWTGEISAIGGIELANPEGSRLRLQILAHYFRGHSPNGQFFDRRIEYVGTGVRLSF